jgi:hypothetical protein
MATAQADNTKVMPANATLFRGGGSSSEKCCRFPAVRAHISAWRNCAWRARAGWIWQSLYVIVPTIESQWRLWRLWLANKARLPAKVAEAAGQLSALQMQHAGMADSRSRKKITCDWFIHQIHSYVSVPCMGPKVLPATLPAAGCSHVLQERAPGKGKTSQNMDRAFCLWRCYYWYA